MHYCVCGELAGRRGQVMIIHDSKTEKKSKTDAGAPNLLPNPA
jgi:hypothetical protein